MTTNPLTPTTTVDDDDDVTTSEEETPSVAMTTIESTTVAVAETTSAAADIETTTVNTEKTTTANLVSTSALHTTDMTTSSKLTTSWVPTTITSTEIETTKLTTEVSASTTTRPQSDSTTDVSMLQETTSPNATNSTKVHCCCRCCYSASSTCKVCARDSLTDASACANEKPRIIKPVDRTTPNFEPPVALKGSQHPERLAYREDFLKLEQLTETLASLSETEKIDLGFKSNELIADCEYHGSPCFVDRWVEYFYVVTVTHSPILYSLTCGVGPATYHISHYIMHFYVFSAVAICVRHPRKRDVNARIKAVLIWFFSENRFSSPGQ